MISKRGTVLARGLVLGLTLLLSSPLVATSAEARAGGGFSFGSRGSRSFSMPPSTNTAPRGGSPFGRSEAQNPGLNGFGAGGALPQRRFGGFGTGLAAGLLGAGLFGMLGGNGFFGGIYGLTSFIGLLFQVGLIGGLVWFGLRALRGRAAPSFASANGGFGGAPGVGFGARQSRPSTVPLTVEPADYTAFERSLVAIQTAFSGEDVNALSRLTTPEMTRYFEGDLEANRSRGVRNLVADVKLLQGDLAEAWREGSTDYATVAMRFDARDTMVDRASGHVVSGDAKGRTAAAELWTFRRDNGGPWLLSGLQQAA